jgi:hypothetical protein
MNLSASCDKEANIRSWIIAPGMQLAKHYVQIGQIVEGGGPAVAAAVRTDERIGLARVDHGPSQFLVVLPRRGPSADRRVGN